MSEWMAKWVIETMNSLGYVGIAFLMFMENLFPPIPSELIMPLAGYTAAQPDGVLAIAPAIIAGVLGTVLGAFPWYYLGKVMGETRLKCWIAKHGRWIGISIEELDKTQRWFHRHGKKAVLFGRLVPVIRTLVSLPAGFSNMPMAQFLIYSTIGTLGWVSLLTGIGYWLGIQKLDYHLVDQYLSPVSKAIAVFLVLAFGVWVVRHWNKRKKSL
ncbi:MAG: DedA family protein [Timaviella obliquedivisa GSE-PSE-MK23-08B]|jgi:membrane protein DedA with SNARE-associated domain|nr:DedA family protein [Timaviella obliquedivisa GSE-PSE-MK23-08B]